MLLRSITKHVKDQNWFAVVLDFFIVVVGILIAFQITNWNEARIAKQSERSFLDRLHNDILELQGRRASYDFSRPFMMKRQAILTEFLYGQRDDLSEAKSLLIGAYPEIEKVNGLVDSFVCNDIFWTSAYTVPPAEIPTASELLSAGRVNDIRSDKVKLALQSYLQQVTRAIDYIEAVGQGSTDLPSTFPELFKIRTIDWGWDINGQTFNKFSCDYESMRSNNPFLSALAANQLRFSNYYFQGVKPGSDKLDLLHIAVDQEIGIGHDSQEEIK